MAFQSAERRILRWIAAGLPDLAKGTELIAARKAARENAVGNNISNRSMKGSRAVPVFDISANENMHRKDMGKTIAARSSGPPRLRSL